MHLAARRRRERADQKVGESRPGVCAPAFPPADDIVALGDEIRCAPEVEILERLAKSGHERFDIRMTATWRVQRILKEHIRSSDLIDDSEVAGRAPEVGEPSSNDGFIVGFL